MTALNEATTKPRPWYRRPMGMLAALVVAGSFLMWAYAFSGAARRDPPDTLSDAAYSQAAEAICAPARASVDALPPAPAARNPQERAAVLRQANATLAAMASQLGTLEADNPRDREITAKWIGDWDRYLADRQAYAAKLATGEDAQFVLTARDGEDYTKTMDNLAKVNQMDSCATPGDV